MSLSDLPIADFEARAAAFLPQMKEDMCVPACLTNVLNDLGKRMAISLKFGLSEMNRLCDYHEGLQCNEKAIPRIIDDILYKRDYTWKVTSGPEMTIDFLRSICENKTFSLPMVGVASSYFEHRGIRTSGRYKLDHALIVMGIDHDVVYLYDPYETLFRRGGYRGQLPRDMPIPSFLTVWDSAQEPRWVAWAQPLPTKQVKLDVEPEAK
jgi:hypothetical protein